MVQQIVKECGQPKHHSRTDPAVTQGTAADLKFVLGELKVQSLQVALNVGDPGGLGDDTGAVLDGPPDQHLCNQTHQSESTSIHNIIQRSIVNQPDPKQRHI